MNLKEITDRHEWDRLLSLLNGHPLQSALWGEARRQVDGLVSIYLAHFENDMPVLLARVETRHVPVLGKVAWMPRGPLFSDDTSREKYLPMLELELSTRGYSLLVTDLYEKNLEHSRGKKVSTIWVDLTEGLDMLAKRIDKQWMYGVRRAAREGVVVQCVSDRDLIAKFHEMCIEISQAKGFELPGSKELMYTLLGSPVDAQAEMRLFVAKHAGEIGAGAIIARTGNHVHYLWGASDRKFSKQRVGEAVQWAVMEWAAAKGCTRYDLEGIDPVNNPGVYAFKKKMGGEEVDLHGHFVTGLNWRGSLIAMLAQRLELV
jgi:peptidoglycan pentaglycine glycine transferase (the first glycine)